MKTIRNLFADKKGATAIEYGVSIRRGPPCLGRY